MRMTERENLQGINALSLVHLKAAIVFVMDISEQCGYSLAQQTALFNRYISFFSFGAFCSYFSVALSHYLLRSLLWLPSIRYSGCVF